jgi:hypothetical protein
VAAGRTVSNGAMKEWFASWGSDDEKDPPACPSDVIDDVELADKPDANDV